MGYHFSAFISGGYDICDQLIELSLSNLFLELNEEIVLGLLSGGLMWVT